jgi:hypothetical protein
MKGGFTPALEADWLRREAEQEVEEQEDGFTEMGKNNESVMECTKTRNKTFSTASKICQFDIEVEMRALLFR